MCGLYVNIASFFTKVLEHSQILVSVGASGPIFADYCSLQHWWDLQLRKQRRLT